MSVDAPWLALSADWMDSEMFDEESSDGCRLAWVVLLCHVKTVGRAGRAKVRAKSLARRYNLSARAVTDMLKSAQEHGAIEIDGDAVTVVNWSTYQRERIRGSRANVGQTDKKTVCRTNCTYTDTDTDSYTDKKNPPSPPAGGKPRGEAGEAKASVSWSPGDGWSNITAEHRQRWGRAYPACNIDRQLASMDAWLRANPNRAKKSNWERFITNWLSKEQDRGGDERGKSAGAAGSASRTASNRPGPDANRGKLAEDLRL